MTAIAKRKGPIIRRLYRVRVAPAFVAWDLTSRRHLVRALRDFGFVRVTLSKEIPSHQVPADIAELHRWALGLP